MKEKLKYLFKSDKLLTGLSLTLGAIGILEAVRKIEEGDLIVGVALLGVLYLGIVLGIIWPKKDK